MRRTTLFVLVATVALVAPEWIRAQEKPVAQPPVRYSETPDEMMPFREVDAARHFFVDPVPFRGAGREDAPPAGLTTVRIGLVAPMQGIDADPGRHMRQGAELAIADANAAGGFGDHHMPFELAIRDEGARWGQAGDALVDLVDKDGAWVVLGGYEDSNNHVMSRVVLKVQVANMETAGVDPTLTEHNVPWVFRNRPDDRRNAYLLLKKIFDEDKRQRVVVFRATDRYGRSGIKQLLENLRRLHHPTPLELRYDYVETDFSARLEKIREANPDAIVVWGRPGPTGQAVRALRDAGITAQIYAPDRVADAAFLRTAGPAAEGVIFTYPLDPRPENKRWTAFRDHYVERFTEEPTPDAAFTYDGAAMSIAAIRKVGLNRPLIRDALAESTTFEGVSGTARFDSTGNDVAPVILGHVEKGKFVFGK